MIKYAKVSLSAVKAFEGAVLDVKEYSPKFDKGIACIEQMCRYFVARERELDGSISEMNRARTSLAEKKRPVEEKLNVLREKRNGVKKELDRLKIVRSRIDKFITQTSANGRTIQVPNPEYMAATSQIASVRKTLWSIEAEMQPFQQRLARINAINRQLASHTQVVKSVIFSLKEKEITCKQLISQLADMKYKNDRKGTSAWMNLKKIEEIISAYLKIKMIYDRSSSTNINVTTNAVSNTLRETNGGNADHMRQQKLSDEEIKSHNIKFDREGRVCEFDGRSYGGKFNAYMDRLNRTSLEDPMRGCYTGDRGESKYIPSTRTVEGVVVADILKYYGLDGIEYRNAEPDFEVCSEAIVRIERMTENRDDYTDANGVSVMGNFSQADIELANVWNAMGRDGKTTWTDEDIYNYRKANKLTWHEKCDTRTMVLVRSEINLYFRHSGGCSECRVRDAVGKSDHGGFDE